MIAIVDYNVGNLLSAQNAFEYLGEKTVVTDREEVLKEAAAIVLPGVGAFPDAMTNLKQKNLDEIIKEQIKGGKPLLGICLGMQLLFEKSDEIRPTVGLSLVPGSVRKINTRYKIPHMGWNSLDFHTPHPLFDGLSPGDWVYFVHSFCAQPKDIADLTASCSYGERVTAAVCRDNVVGVQFHPEKSSRVGQSILKNFCRLIKKM